jgi:hypothetical protein
MSNPALRRSAREFFSEYGLRTVLPVMTHGPPSGGHHRKCWPPVTVTDYPAFSAIRRHSV